MDRSAVAAAARQKWTDRLEVILKLTERCNIDCSYCYVFRGADQSFGQHPARIREDTVDAAAAFLQKGCIQLGVQALQIDFHGGEPLAIGKSRFDRICTTLRAHLDPVTRLTLAIQTNGTLIDEDWVRLFSKYRVSPGVSLDGPAPINDRHRVDFRGRGTYEKVRRGLELLRVAFEQGSIDSLGVLCVIDPHASAKEIFDHFVRDLGIRTIDFLLPDHTHDSMPHSDDGSVGRFLCDAFDAWIERDDPEIFVRVLGSIMSLLLGGRSHMIGFGGEFPAAISIASDGTLGPDDILRSCGTEFFYSPLNVKASTLGEFINSSQMISFFEAGQSTPDHCRFCCWERLCGGGQLVHRFSSDSAFRRQSVYCDSLKIIYSHVANFLIESGELTLDDASRRLCA